MRCGARSGGGRTGGEAAGATVSTTTDIAAALRKAPSAALSARPSGPAEGQVGLGAGAERGAVRVRGRAEPAREVMAERGGVAEPGTRRHRLDAQVGVLQEAAGEEHPLLGDPVVRRGPGLGPEPAG